MNSWYASLTLPPLTPPPWVFGPAWTILYTLIAVSIVVYYRARPPEGRLVTTAVLAFHLLTNFIWSPLFFGLQRPGLALADILLLDVSLVAVILLFRRASRLAAALLAPYLLWVLFATYLNAGIVALN